MPVSAVMLPFADGGVDRDRVERPGAGFLRSGRPVRFRYVTSRPVPAWGNLCVAILVVMAVAVPSRVSGLNGDGTVGDGGLPYPVAVGAVAQQSPDSDGFDVVAAGGFHSCGLRTDGSVTCWGDNQYSQTEVPPGVFTALSAGGHRHSCAVRTNGSVACWGWNRYGQTYAPSGAFTEVAAGYLHSCGLRTDGRSHAGETTNTGKPKRHRDPLPQ